MDSQWRLRQLNCFWRSWWWNTSPIGASCHSLHRHYCLVQGTCQFVSGFSWVVWRLLLSGFWALILIISPLITIETINAIWCAVVKTWNEDCTWWFSMLDKCMVPSTTSPTIFPVPFISHLLGMMTSWRCQLKTCYCIIWAGDSPWVVIFSFQYVLP